MQKENLLLLLGFLIFSHRPAVVNYNTGFIEPAENTSVSNPSEIIREINDYVLKADSPGCSIPFTKIGKLIILKAKVDSMEGNFILDTGAPNLVLNSTYFRNLEIIPGNNEDHTTINGAGEPIQKTILKKFRVGTFDYSMVEADLVNLGNIENIRGIKILGLLGVSLFTECEMRIDYEENMVHLYHISKKERKTYKNKMLNDPQLYSEHDFILRNNRIIVQTKVAKKKMQFVIDYAAETNIIDSRLPGSVLDSVLITGRVLLSGAGSKKVETITGSLAGFEMDKLPVKDFPVIITNLENSCFSNDMCINGVLGYDFLSKHKMLFNFVTRKLYIFK